MSINDYKLEKQIGNGTFGEVYQGIEKSTGLKVAIKRLRKKILYENGNYLLKAFYREIDCMKKCACENSIKYIKDFQTQNNFNIIMELCDKDLLCYLYERPNPFSAEEIRETFSQLNNVFRKMTQNNIVHRDLKLGNILMKFTDEEKTKFIPKLTDYGFSKELNKYNYASCTHLGTPATMAPEIMLNNPYNNKSDLWSVGVMMYQLYFRDVPYDGKNEQDILKKIQSNQPLKQPDDPDLRDLINKLLVFNVQDRLSWREYFEHPFFNPNNKNKNNNNNENCNQNNLNLNKKQSSESSGGSSLYNSYPSNKDFARENSGSCNQKEFGYSSHNQIYDHDSLFIQGNIYQTNDNININTNANKNNTEIYYKKEKIIPTIFFEKNNNKKIEMPGLFFRGKQINDNEYQIITKACMEVIDNNNNNENTFSSNCIQKIKSQLNGEWFVMVCKENDINYDFYISFFREEHFLFFRYKDYSFQIYRMK